MPAGKQTQSARLVRLDGVGERDRFRRVDPRAVQEYFLGEQLDETRLIRIAVRSVDARCDDVAGEYTDVGHPLWYAAFGPELDSGTLPESELVQGSVPCSQPGVRETIEPQVVVLVGYAVIEFDDRALDARLTAIEKMVGCLESGNPNDGELPPNLPWFGHEYPRDEGVAVVVEGERAELCADRHVIGAAGNEFYVEHRGEVGGVLDEVAIAAELVEHPGCIGRRIETNSLGFEEEALAAATSDDGGRFPVGTIVQLIPFEAMVKRKEGLSPATSDWEFFELDVASGTTAIEKRGTTDVVNQFGGNCSSCHSFAEEQWDLICGEDHGCDPLPLTLTREVIDSAQQNDPRCP